MNIFDNQSDMDKLREEIASLRQSIDRATMAIVAGILCTREGYEFNGAVADARKIIEEVGNGGE